MKSSFKIFSSLLSSIVFLAVVSHAFLGNRLGMLQSFVSFGLLFLMAGYFGYVLVRHYRATKLERIKTTEEVIFEIIKGVTSTDDLNELLQLIHKTIERILNAENCFVALINEKTGFMEMQFFVDKNDSVPSPFPIGRGLTSYVYRNGISTLLTSREIEGLIAAGEIELNGTAPAVWMGIPLRTRTGIIGVLVVQHYEDATAYSSQDLELLTMVGDQIALVIERKRFEEAIRTSEEQHRLLFEANPQPAWVYDRETLKFLAVNRTAVYHYGYTRSEFLNEISACDIRPQEDIPGFLERLSHVTSEQDIILAPSRHKKKDGTLIDVEITSHPMVFAGRPAEIVLVNDITERIANEAEAKRLNSEVEKQRLRFHNTLENIPCVVWEVPFDPKSPEAPFPFVNSYIKKMHGYTPDEWTGTPDFWSSTIYPEDRDVVFRSYAELMERGEVTLQSRWRTKDERVIWGETRIATINDKDGRPVGFRGVTADITERKSLEGQLTHQALHDPLTGLPNRVLFRDRLEHAQARAKRTRKPLAVMFLDLDNFKAVNDTLGHAAGDELLVAVTERLVACLRASDTPARLGGDEFAILAEETAQTDGAVLIAERIRTVLAEPYRISGKEVFIGSSIGIATSANQESPEELLRNADVAMYRSKAEGRNRYTVYESGMHDSIIKRVQIESDLRCALDRGEIEVFYQPIVDLQTEKIIGMEALSRWNHSQHGLIPPLDFIPVAEESGLIVAIGAWVLERACVQARLWQVDFDYDDSLSITVNISSRQFQEGDLYETVKTALEGSGLKPHSLVLEITESTMLINTDATIEKLHRLKSLGIKLAVDDFGTGYSSLSYLQRFPIDILKIDKSFIDQIAKGKEGSAVAKAIITMGDTLNLKTIAEGIEHPGQSAELQQLGCMLGQGFHFAKPLSAEAMATFLVESSLNSHAAGSQSPVSQSNGLVTFDS